MHGEDTSKIATKKSTAVEVNASSTDRGDSFWLQVRPVFFLVAIFLLNFIYRVIFSPLLPTLEK